jgi:hypothetical protein
MKIILFLLALSPLSALAQLRCVDKLLPLPRLSAAHQLGNGEWRPGATPLMTKDDAYRALRTLLFAKLLCEPNEIELYATGDCVVPDPYYPELVTCYAYSTLGYFIISQDTQKNANFIFHRVRSNQK